jgi:hypothetical protein
MKKLFLFVLFLPLFVSAQSQIEICECADLFLSLEKEKRETKGHSYKIREKQNEQLKALEAIASFERAEKEKIEANYKL